MSITMDILLIMCAGGLIGNRIFPAKYKKFNEYAQVICTCLLIFSMGVMLGRRENFIKELTSLGLQSFILCFIPSFFSMILVFILSRKFMEKKDKEMC